MAVKQGGLRWSYVTAAVRMGPQAKGRAYRIAQGQVEAASGSIAILCRCGGFALEPRILNLSFCGRLSDGFGTPGTLKRLDSTRVAATFVLLQHSSTSTLSALSFTGVLTLHCGTQSGSAIEMAIFVDLHIPQSGWHHCSHNSVDAIGSEQAIS